MDRSARGLAASGADEEDALRAARRQVQVDRSDAFKRSRTREREWLDEVAPKATGREATIEKKIAAREERRMAADSPERARLDGGGSIMGGGDSFAAAKARCAGLGA